MMQTYVLLSADGGQKTWGQRRDGASCYIHPMASMKEANPTNGCRQTSVGAGLYG